MLVAADIVEAITVPLLGDTNWIVLLAPAMILPAIVKMVPAGTSFQSLFRKPVRKWENPRCHHSP